MQNFQLLQLGQGGEILDLVAVQPQAAEVGQVAQAGEVLDASLGQTQLRDLGKVGGGQVAVHLAARATDGRVDRAFCVRVILRVRCAKSSQQCRGQHQGQLHARSVPCPPSIATDL